MSIKEFISLFSLIKKNEGESCEVETEKCHSDMQQLWCRQCERIHFGVKFLFIIFFSVCMIFFITEANI